jgi:tRNA(fMet)-specific endonuclease VapC
MRYLLDTNICIYLIKHKPAVVLERFRQLDVGDIGISSVTLAELLYGVHKSQHVQKNMDALERFVAPLQILPFDEQDVQDYGKIRADLERTGTPIGAYDLQIAAQAVTHKLVLVTNNVKEFRRIEGLRMENWAAAS